MKTDDVLVVLLAAGFSKRFGKCKLLAKFDGNTLLEHSLNALQAFPRKAIISGGYRDDVEAECKRLGMDENCFYHNELAETGMLSSVQLGISIARDMNVPAFMIMLADMPLVTKDHINASFVEFKKNPQIILSSNFNGVKGPPAWFPRSFYLTFKESYDGLMPDSGLKPILKHSRLFNMPEAAYDIDTKAELENLSHRLERY